MNAEQAGRRVALASMLISVGLAGAKIIIGLRANSTALVSDGMESAGDVLSSGLVLLGLIMASQPPDVEHPYGHGRLETLSALVVGIMLVVAGSLISFRSLERVDEVQHLPAAYAIWPLIASIGIKWALSVTKRRYGRKIRSSALMADAWNDTVDVLSGGTALLGLGLTLIDPLKFVSADHWGGCAVGVIVIFLGIRSSATRRFN